MRGAPFPRDITDKYEDPPKTKGKAEFVSNLSASKTQFN